MSEDLSKDVWSKQFYKALEAAGNLTEQERLKLGNMLIALSPVKQPDKVLRAIEDAKYSLEEQERIFELQRGGRNFTHSETNEEILALLPYPPEPPPNRKAGMF